MKYEHLENETSAEIISKAYNRVEIAARHLWPMYVYWYGYHLITSIGTLAYIFSLKWWLLLTVLIPFAIETYISSRTNYNIYVELETYWKKERKYTTLGDYLKSRNYTKELKAYGNFDYLIDTYEKRLNERNRDYERYYFKHLRRKLFGDNITKLASIVNVIILLVLFIHRQISVGLFIALSALMMNQVYFRLGTVAGFFKWSGFHVNTYEYYDKYFQLSDEPEGTETELPGSFDIEFKDVWFRYPGTDRDILKGLSLKIHNGEKVSIVGENGGGKTTMIKLLTGMLEPAGGEILINGRR